MCDRRFCISFHIFANFWHDMNTYNAVGKKQTEDQHIQKNVNGLCVCAWEKRNAKQRKCHFTYARVIGIPSHGSTIAHQFLVHHTTSTSNICTETHTHTYTHAAYSENLQTDWIRDMKISTICNMSVCMRIFYIILHIYFIKYKYNTRKMIKYVHKNVVQF